MISAWVVAAVLAGLPLPPVTPVPAWVEQVELPQAKEGEGGGARLLLDDVQVRIGKSWERSVRRAWKVRSQAGVEALARQEFEWEPSWQQLELHGVWVRRGGERRVAWDPEDARVIQSESDRFEGIYDGRLTLSLELRDVRVGDVVELAYTLRGENPVFKGHVTLTEWQQRSEPVDLLRFRLDWQRPRPLAFEPRGGGLAPTVSGSSRQWELKDVKAWDLDSSVPDDLDEVPGVTFSDWQSWEEVGRWAQALFDQKASGARYEKELARFKALPETERAAAVVRFVQDDVRYVGVETGEHSHLPHAPSWVLERGFGDCKDKALLLSSLLRATGEKAWPALVHSSQGKALPRRLPTPHLFNHAIVMLELPEGPRFIDATRTLRRGPVAKMDQPPFHHALVVRPGEVGLTPITFELPVLPTWEVEQSWVVRRGEKTRLKLTTTARGLEAFVLRRQMTSSTNDEVQRDMHLRRERQLSTKLVPLSVKFTDDEVGEVVTLVEEYEVDAFYVGGKHEFVTLAASADLRRVDDVTRTKPMSLPHPVAVREVISWDSPERLVAGDYDLTNKTFTHPAMMVTVSQQVVSGSRLVLEWRLNSMKDRIAGDELASYASMVKEVEGMLGYEVTEAGHASSRTRPKAKGDPEAGYWTLAFLAVVLVLGFSAVKGAEAFSRWLGRRRQVRFKKSQAGRPGELASQPAQVSSVQVAHTLFTSQGCPRGHAWGEIGLGEGVRLGDERITVLVRKCGTCDEREHRYVKLPQLVS